MLSIGMLVAAAALTTEPVSLVQVDRVAGSELDAPIRLWLNNNRQFREGEKARVQVETRDDGYLLVFNYDTDGRLRVIFPVDPRDDNFVRAGRRYEIRGRGDRESFIVEGDGDGVVYAAVSADPFRVNDLEANGNWDYGQVRIGDNSRDPEADVTDLLQRISTDRGFDYDVLTYRVYGAATRYVDAWYPRPRDYYWDNYCDPFYRPSLFGCRYYPTGGWYLGYSRYGYGGGYGWGGYGYGWNDPWYRNRYVYSSGRRNYPVVAGRPRSYTIVRRGEGNNNNFGRSGTVGGGGGAVGRPRSVIDYRPRGGSQPNDRSVGRPSNDARPNSPSGDRPRARRSPPSGDSNQPMIDRDRGNRRSGPVDFGNESTRSAPPARRSNDDEGSRSERPRSVDRERDQPRAEPRRESPPAAREQPRRESPPAAREQPRRESAPKSEPRRESPRSEPSRPRERPRNH